MDTNINWNKNRWSSDKLIGALKNTEMKDMIRGGQGLEDLVNKYLPENHKQLAGKLVDYYGDSTDDVVDYLNAAIGGEGALKEKARAFADNIASNGDTNAFSGVMSNIFNGTGTEGSDFSSAAIKAISGGSQADIFKQRQAELANQRNIYIQGAMHAAGQNSYMEKQKIIEAQRKYGITGAVASAQMQDYELKNKQALEETQLKASAQWDQLHGSNQSALQTSTDMAQVTERQGFLKQIADGKFSSVGSAQNTLKTLGVSDAWKQSMTPEVLQELLGNKSGLSTQINARTNTHAPATDK